MDEYIEREALLAEYDRQHTGEPGRARKLIEGALGQTENSKRFCLEARHGKNGW